MKRATLFILLSASLCSQAEISKGLWYSLAASASAHVAHKSGKILKELQVISNSELLNRYSEGIGFLSAIALTYFAWQETQK